ncbi:hypothetical protein SPX-AbuGharib_153 [Sheeppox virus]|uniref:Uncharacterized protein n=1 Tax=Sheeppox virus TaxID=10266 RepID=A0A5C0PVB6_SHEV|nr:hypothetical protein SPX-AbuGharib_004 [Sheeppox virus]QEJ79750.1 hypothetical protein SPX-AbuGharib_153 [Sheeppox virus]
MITSSTKNLFFFVNINSLDKRKSFSFLSYVKILERKKRFVFKFLVNNRKKSSVVSRWFVSTIRHH